MTYIKPEPASNQSPTSIQEILHLGLAAVQQQDWLSVNEYLKLLPQTKSRKKAKKFLLNESDWQVAFDIATELLMEADFQHKWEVSKLIPLFGSRSIPTLIALVKDETIEADIRWFVCQILGNFPDERVILTLVELLQQTTEGELIEMAGKTLTAIGKDAVDALESLLSEPEYRSLAVQSLSYIRTVETIPPLLKVANDPDPQLRAIAIKSLSSFHDSRIPPTLIAALQDKASSVRQEAAIALGFRPDLCDELDLVDSLSPLLKDFNLEVCRQAAISLGRMQQPSATTALFEVLQADTTPEILKIDIVKTLGWSKIPSAINYLERALVNATPTLLQEIIISLGRTNVPELKHQAANVLIEFWQRYSDRLESSQLRQAFATSLGELRCNCARATLEQLAEDSDRKVKLYAQSALRKVV